MFLEWYTTLLQPYICSPHPHVIWLPILLHTAAIRLKSDCWSFFMNIASWKYVALDAKTARQDTMFTVTLQKNVDFLSPVDLMISNTTKHEWIKYCETTYKANQRCYKLMQKFLSVLSFKDRQVLVKSDKHLRCCSSTRNRNLLAPVCGLRMKWQKTDYVWNGCTGRNFLWSIL